MEIVLSHEFEVTTVCNALMDIVVDVTDDDLIKLGYDKSIMTLVNEEEQKKILDHFKNHQHAIELGGSAMNAIRALALLKKKTSFTGMISEDRFGNEIKDRMFELGIKPNLGITDMATGTCLILVTPDGERTMLTYLGASLLYNSEHIPHNDIKSSKVFHFCGYQWGTENQKIAIKAAIKTAKENGTKISFDVADPFVVRANRDEFIELIKNDADIVFANKEEAKLLYDLESKETAAKIAETGAIAVIKIGSEGAIIQEKDTIYKIDPVKTEVVDTTAAGDMFAGGFLYGYTSGLTHDKSGHIAASLASDVISRYGATLSKEVLEKVLAI